MVSLPRRNKDSLILNYLIADRKAKGKGEIHALSDDQFIHPDQTQNIAGLLVQQVEIEVIVRQATVSVLHLGQFDSQPITFRTKLLYFCRSLNAPQHSMIALDRGERKVTAECQRDTDEE